MSQPHQGLLPTPSTGKKSRKAYIREQAQLRRLQEIARETFPSTLKACEEVGRLQQRAQQLKAEIAVYEERNVELMKDLKKSQAENQVLRDSKQQAETMYLGWYYPLSDKSAKLEPALKEECHRSNLLEREMIAMRRELTVARRELRPDQVRSVEAFVAEGGPAEAYHPTASPIAGLEIFADARNRVSVLVPQYPT